MACHTHELGGKGNNVDWTNVEKKIWTNIGKGGQRLATIVLIGGTKVDRAHRVRLG